MQVGVVGHKIFVSLRGISKLKTFYAAFLHPQNTFGYTSAKYVHVGVFLVTVHHMVIIKTHKEAVFYAFKKVAAGAAFQKGSIVNSKAAFFNKTHGYLFPFFVNVVTSYQPFGYKANFVAYVFSINKAVAGGYLFGINTLSKISQSLFFYMGVYAAACFFKKELGLQVVHRVRMALSIDLYVFNQKSYLLCFQKSLSHFSKKLRPHIYSCYFKEFLPVDDNDGFALKLYNFF